MPDFLLQPPSFSRQYRPASRGASISIAATCAGVAGHADGVARRHAYDMSAQGLVFAMTVALLASPPLFVDAISRRATLLHFGAPISCLTSRSRHRRVRRGRAQVDTFSARH